MAGTCVIGTAFEIARATTVENPGGAGLVVGGNAWPGWRFEVPSPEVSSFAFGAQGGSGTIRDGQSTVTGSQLAFSLIQSTGEIVLQGVAPRLFIRGFAF